MIGREWGIERERGNGGVIDREGVGDGEGEGDGGVIDREGVRDREGEGEWRGD